MKINVLGQDIANMIAAGEVVERPSSVVKELVENSIDAGAKTITVEIKRGGMEYIRVTDDGSGIESGEVETAFLRHATSKIKTKEDLNSIYTLGFRGEALASVAAVAKIEIFTKTKDSDFGKTVTIEGGEVTDSSQAGCPDGTTIVVRDLFYNTPARMKFLKSDSTEGAHVSDIINKIILSHPEIKIKFISNGKMTVSSSGDGRLLSAIGTVFGKDFMKNMIEVDFTEDGAKVKGYVGNPSVMRKDRRSQVFFINSRYFVSKIFSSALSEAFENVAMSGKFPFAVLMADVDARFVDVNVHPAKTEVRFSDDKKVFSLVYWAVKNALANQKYIPDISFPSKTNTFANHVFEHRAKETPKNAQISIDFSKNTAPIKEDKVNETKKDIEEKIETQTFFKKEEVNALSSPVLNHTEYIPQKDYVKEEIKDVPKEETVTEKLIPPAEEKTSFDISPIEEETPTQNLPIADVDFKIIGQVFSTYIIVQSGDEMLIIDQHAAQERLFYEEILDEYEKKGVSVQYLLLPQTVSLDPVTYALCSENKDFFESIGFECEPFGEREFIIRALPSFFSQMSAQELFEDTANLLKANTLKNKTDLVKEALHTMSCKRAIKGGHSLSEKEMKSLIEKVLSLKNINTCPHGRPIMSKMTKREIEKQFKRIV